MGAKITGSKTTKAKERESLKAARTKHRVGVGQLFIQPTAHADRAAAQAAPAEEQAAVDFVKSAVSHVRPTAPYAPAAKSPMAREAECLECGEYHRNGASCAPATFRPAGTREFKHRGWTVLVGGAMISEAQAKWIIDIAERPTVTAEMKASLATRLEQGFAKSAGSQFITRYKDTPTAAAEVAREEAVNPGPGTNPAKVQADVPAGWYALRGEDGVVKFYKLDRPTKGQWAGWTFLKAQASDELYPIRNKAEKARIIAEIGKNILGAERLYGQELGKCSRCGRTLTDETSRAYGIGPDCRNK